jgi:hypothetical protein
MRYVLPDRGNSVYLYAIRRLNLPLMPLQLDPVSKGYGRVIV